MTHIYAVSIPRKIIGFMQTHSTVMYFNLCWTEGPSIANCYRHQYKWYHGHLTRCATLRVVHAPGMLGTFPPPPWVRDPDMHHGTCVTHVPWCMPWSFTSGFLWSQWRGKRSRHSRRIRNPQFCLSGKRPMSPFLLYRLSILFFLNASENLWSK